MLHLLKLHKGTESSISTSGSRPGFGICGYYVEFYKNFSNVITPLTDLSDHVDLFACISECQDSFRSAEALLIAPDFARD